MSYNQKKFLDYDGLIHLLKKFDDYPTNDILGTVIDSIGTAIDAKVSNVQVNNISIVDNGIANIPIANQDNSYGVVKVRINDNAAANMGITANQEGLLRVNPAVSADIKSGTAVYRPIVANTQHAAAFYGLAKAAGDTTQSESSNAVGTYTNAAKTAIQTMLDVPSNATVTSAIGTAIGNVHQFNIEVVQALPTENIQEHTVYFVPKTGETNDVYDEYVYVNNGWEMIGNTQIDLSNYVQKTDYPSSTQSGVVKISDSYGIYKTGDNTLRIWGATDTLVKEGTNAYRPLIPSKQHQSVFYGLAKAAGDTTQSQSDNTVGTYTDDAKTAIKSMLGVSEPTDVQINGTSIVQNGIASIPIASNGSGYGLVKTISYRGLYFDSEGRLEVNRAGTADCKAGTHVFCPVVPSYQHYSVFYGLAKAAGADEKDSTLSLGTYSDNAKTAIRTMLGAAAASDIPSVPVQDVQIENTSIVTNGIANFTKASYYNFGVVKTDTDYGTQVQSSGHLNVVPAELSVIKAAGTGKVHTYRPITPRYQHYSTFYGLAKAAGDMTQSSSDNAVGIYTDEAKDAIQNMLGISSLISARETSTATTAHTLNSLFLMNGKLYRATAAIAIGDAVVEGQNCEVVKMEDVFVKKTDYATATVGGVVKINPEYYGINIYNGFLRTQDATSTAIKGGTTGQRPISPNLQHEATFYGLSKLAGIDLANETVTVGTYPETSKTAIRSLIGAIGATDYATSTTGGVVLVAGNGLGISSTNGKMYISCAESATVKAGANWYYPIVPQFQHEAAFYGLAKAAGADMASSNNSVGTYTDTAKTAIRNMIGATSNKVVAIQDEQPTDTDTKVWLPETQAAGVQIPTMEDMENYVQKTDIATSSTPGIVKVNNDFGLGISNGSLYIYETSDSYLKAGTNKNKAVTASKEHIATFYGLAKAAGDTTQSASNNAVGTYTADASAAIRTMLGAVGKTDYPPNTGATAGVVKVDNTYSGVSISGTNTLILTPITDAVIKNGTSAVFALNAQKQHQSVFYGLAKAAGDTTQSQSDNAVGTYTNTAKAAICSMLGVSSSENIPFEYGNGLGAIQAKSITFGNNSLLCKAEGIGSFAVGIESEAYGVGAIAQGSQVIAYGWESHAEGMNSISYGEYSHAEGQGTFAIGNNSHAEGSALQSNGIQITGAENATTYTYSNTSNIFPGLYIYAKGIWAKIIAVDTENNTITTDRTLSSSFNGERAMVFSGAALGLNSHVEGLRTIANGNYTHVEGCYNNPDTIYSEWTSNTNYTIGDKVTRDGIGYKCIEANTDSSFTSSKWELIYKNNDTAFIIGNGTSHTNRSNAYTLDWTGNGHYAGNVYVNCNSDSTGGTKLVSEADYATPTKAGVIKSGDGTYGIRIANGGEFLVINCATTEEIKTGTMNYKPLTAMRQHASTFYGLAKAAGDTTQSASSNAIGTYTTEAKSAIQSMLGVENGVSFVENISGTTPTIIGEPNTRYMCGEVSVLTITPPANGIIDVIFSSGSTATVLTLPSGSTIKWPKWFDPTALEPNMTYEINIMDNIYGAVMTW